MKTISEKLREHALGPLGARPAVDAEEDAVFDALVRLKPFSARYSELKGDERRMYALFVAEALEKS